MTSSTIRLQKHTLPCFFFFLPGFLPLIAGCNRPVEAAAKETPARSFVTVSPVRQSLPVVIEQPGQIEAIEQTPIHPKIMGYVSEVCVDMNSRVEKGACLAKLWVPEMDEDLNQKKALIIQAQAELEQAEKKLRADEANLHTTKALIKEAQSRRKRAQATLERWESEDKRMNALVLKKVIDVQTRDEVHHQYKSALAECEEIDAKIEATIASLKESEARRDKANADVQVAAARKKVAEVNEVRTQAMLNYATLTAPFKGVITQRFVHTGHLLKPAGNGKGEPLFVLVRTDRVRIFVDVPESAAAFVKPGKTRARVRIQALKDREIEATVNRISWVLDPSNRTLRAEIELPNTKDEELRPGMYAYASIFVEYQGWTLPASAVQHKDDGCFCVTMNDDGKTALTPLRVARRHGPDIEVLKKRDFTDSGPEGRRWREFTGHEKILETFADLR